MNPEIRLPWFAIARWSHLQSYPTRLRKKPVHTPLEQSNKLPILPQRYSNEEEKTEKQKGWTRKKWSCLSTFYFKSLLFVIEWLCILVFMNTHFTISLQTNNDAFHRMQPNHSSEVYISLIQRELAVLNKKIAKLCSVNRQLITQAESCEEKKLEHELVLSVDSLSALLLILYSLPIELLILDGRSQAIRIAWQNCPIWTSLSCLTSRLSFSTFFSLSRWLCKGFPFLASPRLSNPPLWATTISLSSKTAAEFLAISAAFQKEFAHFDSFPSFLPSPPSSHTHTLSIHSEPSTFCFGPSRTSQPPPKEANRSDTRSYPSHWFTRCCFPICSTMQNSNAYDQKHAAAIAPSTRLCLCDWCTPFSRGDE